MHSRLAELHSRALFLLLPPPLLSHNPRHLHLHLHRRLQLRPLLFDPGQVQQPLELCFLRRRLQLL